MLHPSLLYQSRQILHPVYRCATARRLLVRGSCHCDMRRPASCDPRDAIVNESIHHLPGLQILNKGKLKLRAASLHLPSEALEALDFSSPHPCPF